LSSQAAHPQEILVVIVGEFHVEFGGGLPSELKRLGANPVTTLLQVEVADWRPETLAEAVAADPQYGEHADYLWVRQTGRTSPQNAAAALHLPLQACARVTPTR
jgi:hypothetical protein